MQKTQLSFSSLLRNLSFGGILCEHKGGIYLSTIDAEYISEDEGSFSCRYTHGDVEGEGKAKGVKGVTDFKDGGMFLRGRMD